MLDSSSSAGPPQIMYVEGGLAPVAQWLAINNGSTVNISSNLILQEQGRLESCRETLLHPGDLLLLSDSVEQSRLLGNSAILIASAPGVGLFRVTRVDPLPVSANESMCRYPLRNPNRSWATSPYMWEGVNKT